MERQHRRCRTPQRRSFGTWPTRNTRPCRRFFKYSLVGERQIGDYTHEPLDGLLITRELRQCGAEPGKRLGLEKFVKALLTDKYDVVAIKYFTARVTKDGDTDQSAPLSIVRHKLKKVTVVFNPHKGECHELRRFSTFSNGFGRPQTRTRVKGARPPVSLPPG